MTNLTGVNFDTFTKSVLVKDKKPGTKYERITSAVLQTGALVVGPTTFVPSVQKLAVDNGRMVCGDNFFGDLVGIHFLLASWFTWGMFVSFALKDLALQPKHDFEKRLEEGKEINAFVKAGALTFAGALGLTIKLSMLYITRYYQDDQNQWFWPVWVAVWYAAVPMNSLYGSLKDGIVFCKRSGCTPTSLKASLKNAVLPQKLSDREQFLLLIALVADQAIKDGFSDTEKASELIAEWIDRAKDQDLTLEVLKSKQKFIEQSKAGSLGRWAITSGRYIWQWLLIQKAVNILPNMPFPAPEVIASFGVLAYVHLTDRAVGNRCLEASQMLHNIICGKSNFPAWHKLITTYIGVMGVNTTVRFVYDQLADAGPWKWYVGPAEVISAVLMTNFAFSGIVDQGVELGARCIHKTGLAISDKKIALYDRKNNFDRWFKVLSELDDDELKFLAKDVISELEKLDIKKKHIEIINEVMSYFNLNEITDEELMKSLADISLKEVDGFDEIKEAVKKTFDPKKWDCEFLNKVIERKLDVLNLKELFVDPPEEP